MIELLKIYVIYFCVGYLLFSFYFFDICWGAYDITVPEYSEAKIIFISLSILMALFTKLIVSVDRSKPYNG